MRKKEKVISGQRRSEVILSSLLKVDTQERLLILMSVLSTLGVMLLPDDSILKAKHEPERGAIAGANYAAGLIELYGQIISNHQKNLMH